jgi:hypothetical protein
MRYGGVKLRLRDVYQQLKKENDDFNLLFALMQKGEANQEMRSFNYNLLMEAYIAYVTYNIQKIAKVEKLKKCFVKINQYFNQRLFSGQEDLLFFNSIPHGLHRLNGAINDAYFGAIQVLKTFNDKYNPCETNEELELAVKIEALYYKLINQRFRQIIVDFNPLEIETEMLLEILQTNEREIDDLVVGLEKEKTKEGFGEECRQILGLIAERNFLGNTSLPRGEKSRNLRSWFLASKKEARVEHTGLEEYIR